MAGLSFHAIVMSFATASVLQSIAEDWSLKPEVFGKACWDAAAAAQVAFPGKVRASNKYPMGGFSGQRHLLFVGLPLALYCSDCPHLYQVLQRMRGLASLDEGAPTAETLRQKRGGHGEGGDGEVPPVAAFGSTAPQN
eukprot:g21376.t1